MYSSDLFLPDNYAQNTRNLVVSGILQASIPESPVDDDMAWDYGCRDVVLQRVQYRPCARAMLVTGNSMDDGTEQAICHGDIVLVDPQITFSIHHDTRNTVIQTNNGYIVKERGMVNGKHFLLSRNPAYPPCRYEADWKLVGVVYAIYLGPGQVKWM